MSTCTLRGFEADGTLPATTFVDALAARLFFALGPAAPASPYGTRTIRGEGGALACSHGAFTGFSCVLTRE